MQSFDFLKSDVAWLDKPGTSSKRAFIKSDSSLSLCVECEGGAYKKVLHLLHDELGHITEAYFCKGEPFFFDNFSEVLEPARFDCEVIESKVTVFCCEVVFALKGALSVTGIRRVLESGNNDLIDEVSMRVWDEDKYKHIDPTVVGHEAYLQDVAERELAKMQAALKSTNPATMKKAGRDFLALFTFPPKAGQRDLRLHGLPWHRIACALLYHLKLRIWLRRPSALWLLLRLFTPETRIREVSGSDAIWAVVLSKAEKPPGASVVDAIACGDAEACSAAGLVDDEEWERLDPAAGLLGRVARAAIATLAQGSLVEFGAPASTLRDIGFGDLLVSEAEIAGARGSEKEGGAAAAALGESVGVTVGKPLGSGPGGGVGVLEGLLRGLGVKEIARGDLAWVMHGGPPAAG